MTQPLDPDHITPDVSLNRVWIMDLPGLALEADIRGRRAADLLRAAALAALIRQHAPALELTDAELADESALPLALDRRLGAADPAIRAPAEAIARQFGRRLAALLLTLKRGDAVNRAARPDWDDSYWAHWAGMRQIWLGGGLLSGRLGPLALTTAAAQLAEAGVTDCTVQLAEQPGILPLLGAARSVPPGDAAAGVLDFGGTAIKRARATYTAGRLTGLQPLPPLPVHVLTLLPLPVAEQIAVLSQRMVDALVATWQAVAGQEEPPTPVLVASIACYLIDNQPMAYQAGPYSELRALSPNLGAWLAAQVSAHIGQPLSVQLIHDGTAAARVYAGTPHSAVIMLGTALGVGFPPQG
jgi:hypothetical protein